MATKLSNTTTLLHASEHERIRYVLARVQELNPRSNKHQHIRINHWVKKLLDQPVSNPTWLKNVMEHAATLLQMLLDQALEEPFTKMPPQGPLPTLPRHKVARLAGRSGSSQTQARGPAARCSSSTSKPSTQLLQRLLQDNAFVDDDNSGLPEQKRKVMHTKQIQTSEQDDQFEWQRVWKGAFEKMQSQLLERTAQIQAMAAEMKELHALVAAQKHALDREEHARENVKAKHQAELTNLRSVHALELESLQAKHKKKLQEVSLQNEALLRDRRREKQSGAAFNMQSESYGEFLAYIDDFYADTLKLTQTQSA